MSQHSVASEVDRKIGRSRVADWIVGDTRERIFGGELSDGSRLSMKRELTI